MRIPYHQISRMARTALREAQKQQDDPCLMLESLVVESHYDDAAHLHAATCFILNETSSTACRQIARERGLHIRAARDTLSEAITSGPERWLKNPEWLYDRGMLQAENRYYVAPDELKKGSAYDTARRQLLPQAQVLLEKATVVAFGRAKLREDIALGPVTLQYVAAQLMEEGSEKKCRFSALSLERDPSKHSLHIQYSARAALHFAREEGMDLSTLNIALVQDESRASNRRGQKTGSALRPAHRHSLEASSAEKSQGVHANALYRSVIGLFRQENTNG